MKLILALVLAVSALAMSSCSSTSAPPSAAGVVAKADKAAADASSLLATYELGGNISKPNADKLRAEIAKGRALAAAIGRLDFSDARAAAASLAASGALPPDYALAIQGALLVSDLFASTSAG